MDLTNFNLAVHCRIFVRRGGNKKTGKRRHVKVDYKRVRNIKYFVYDNSLRKEADATDFILPEDNGPNRQLENNTITFILDISSPERDEQKSI